MEIALGDVAAAQHDAAFGRLDPEGDRTDRD
jgi:hypothetical protein